MLPDVIYTGVGFVQRWSLADFCKPWVNVDANLLSGCF
jgi:hypothetical protein